MKKHFLFLAFIACILFSCKPKVELEKPNVVTFPVTEITENSAVVGGNVTSDGGAEVTSRGVCWSLEKNPTIDNNKTSDGNGTGEFTSELTELNDSTTYYVRAYAINSEGVSYGEEYSFTTLKVESEDGNGNGNGDEGENGDENEDEDEDEIVIELPLVVTVSVADITETSAVCGGEVTSDGGAEVTSRGVCWSLSQNPTISDNHTSDGSGTGTFTSNILNLVPNTQYYVRAYATNEIGTSYGEEVSFTTLEIIEDEDDEEEGFINGYEYVDLGLPSGTKWAKCNIGAASPHEFGDYFAWGETEPKSEYTESNSLTNGLPLADISGNANYDAATAKWGASWRIPTREEMDELCNNCTWQWTTENDVPGYKVIGNNDNYIFIPAAGFLFNTSSYFVEEYGYYWTSVSGTENYNGGFSLCFGNESFETAWYFRYAGLTIRPVSD